MPTHSLIWLLSHATESNNDTRGLIKHKKDIIRTYKRFANNSWCVSESVSRVRQQEKYTKANLEREKETVTKFSGNFSKHYRCGLEVSNIRY